MCFAFDARPPDLPRDLVRPRIAGGAAAEILELTSGDGTHFSAALAETGERGATGVVVLPDVRGLYAFYIELTERFAAAGHPSIAIDYFGRSAGLGPRDEDFDYWTHVTQTTVEQVQADARAAQEALRERAGVGAAVTVGFCFGGMHAFLAGTDAEAGWSGEVGFYGALDATRFGISGPLERAGEIRGPVLGLFGEADQAISLEQVHDFESRLEAAGVEHGIVTYPGAPHSFFDRRAAEHAEASEDAWRRVLGFLEQVGARTGAPAG